MTVSQEDDQEERSTIAITQRSQTTREQQVDNFPSPLSYAAHNGPPINSVAFQQS